MTTVDRIPDRAPPDLDEMFRRYADRLWSVALRMLGDRTEAEDAVQEAFLSALRSPGFRGDAATGTWLHRILVNDCVDRLRAAGRRRDRLRALETVVAARDHAGGLVVRLAVSDALALLPVEDALALDEQPNLPGTVEVHPNWRRRLPDPLPQAQLTAALQGFAEARRVSAVSEPHP